jgi:hypothetical protein
MNAMRLCIFTPETKGIIAKSTLAEASFEADRMDQDSLYDYHRCDSPRAAQGNRGRNYVASVPPGIPSMPPPRLSSVIEGITSNVLGSRDEAPETSTR